MNGRTRSRTKILPKAILLVIALIALAMPATSTAPRKAEAEPRGPNIVFVMTDDMREDEMSRVGGLVRLARSGTTFENSFVTDPLCCPSRATALRGQYAHNHGVVSNHPPTGGWRKFKARGHERSALPVWLKRSGYKTGLFGRYLNGYKGKGAPPGWDYWVPIKALSSTANVNGTVKRYSRPTYGDDIAGKEAASFIRANKGKTPLFLALWFKSPHAPYNPPKRYANRHNGASFDKPPSFGETDVSDKPGWVRNLPQSTDNDWNAAVADRRNRLEMLEAVAANVERVKGALRETGDLKNTYFVFTSDNGFLFGEHRANGKKNVYEESIGVPLTISGPGVSRGALRKELVTNNDLAPTILSLASTRQKSFFDGRSLKPLLKAGTSPSWRNAFLVEHWRDRTTAIPDYKAVRTKDRIYVRYSTGEEELYDLAADPYQLENLAGSRPLEKADLKSKLDRLIGCAGGGCRSAEGP